MDEVPDDAWPQLYDNARWKGSLNLFLTNQPNYSPNLTFKDICYDVYVSQIK